MTAGGLPTAGRSENTFQVPEQCLWEALERWGLLIRRIHLQDVQRRIYRGERHMLRARSTSVLPVLPEERTRSRLLITKTGPLQRQVDSWLVGGRSRKSRKNP